MAQAQKMTKSALFAFFADKFEVKRTEVRDWFDELGALAEKELKRSGEFTLPGVVKLSVRKSKARMGRNPATGEPVKIKAKTVAKITPLKSFKDSVLAGKPPKKSAAKKAAAKRVMSAKKAPTKKTAAKRSVVKKSPARKTTTARKATAKKR